MNFKEKLKQGYQPQRETVAKFVLLFAVFIIYFLYLSYEYGFKTGGFVAGLTWSFFVLCTPVADAGFLLDFPVRLISGVRMLITEIFVWGIAIFLNVYGVLFSPSSYESTFLTTLLYKILTEPYPYWSIVILCCLGTFASVYFGDEVMDVVKYKDCEKYHKHGFKYRILLLIAFFGLIIVAYYHLLESLGLNIPQL